MIKSIEKELKYMVEENEFYILKEYLDLCNFPNRTIIQTNFYFDTSDYDLKSKGITLRLRKIDHLEYYLTLKSKTTEVDAGIIDNLHIKNEFNLQLDQTKFDLLKSTKDIRMQVDIFELIKNLLGHDHECTEISMRGYLTTERISFQIPGFFEPILLDKNTYLNKVDYEIEWETEEIKSAQQKIKSIFNDLRIITQLNSVSKSNRFIKLQKELFK